MRRRALLLAAGACALVATSGFAGGGGSGAPVYALTGGPGTHMLSPRDPATLAQIGPGVPLADSAGPTRFSPDGSKLAFVEWTNDARALRILDLRSGRWLGPVPLVGTGTVVVRWMSDGVVLALAERPDGLRALLVDVAALRVVRSARIADEHLADFRYVAVTPAGAAVLLGPYFGQAQVAIVRPSGRVRVVRLARVREGGIGREMRRPALVADPSTSRAFVLGAADDPVAEVDLANAAVSYHALRRRIGLLGARIVQPFAAWLGEGRIVVAASDGNTSGLFLLDTRSWSARKFGRQADFLWIAGRTIVAEHGDGTLDGFSFSGRLRFTVSDPSIPSGTIPLSSNGRYLYVPHVGDERTLVIDLVSGSVVGRSSEQYLNAVLSPADALAGSAAVD